MRRPERHIDEAPGPGPDMSGMTAVERKDTRYRRRRAFLRSIGLPGARTTEGRPDRPSSSPARRREYRRRHYIRKVAEQYGISPGEAEALTPRRPSNGQRRGIVRDASGRFISTTRGSAPRDKV